MSIGALTLVWHASAPAQTSATPVWVLPAVGLIGVIAGALIAGAVRIWGDAVARRASAQLDAIYETQEGALAVRTALIAYGQELPRPTSKTVSRLDKAQGRLDLLVQRLENAPLRLCIEDWRVIAQRFWTDDEFVYEHDERTAWRRVHYQSGEQLRYLDRLFKARY